MHSGKAKKEATLSAMAGVVARVVEETALKKNMAAAQTAMMKMGT